jgi:hypothetical protein
MPPPNSGPLSRRRSPLVTGTLRDPCRTESGGWTHGAVCSASISLETAYGGKHRELRQLMHNAVVVILRVISLV